ncbi:MAG: ArsR/SmtB family transcription factor [Nitrosopumilus sp.]
MNSENDKNEDIEIISTDDEKIKLVGEIFSNDSSRKILNLLNAGNEMTINEIAQNTDLSLALVTHHLKRMQSAQLVKVSKIGRSIKGNDMKYYSATNQSLLIVPSKEPVKSIVNSLKKFSKFVAIGLAGFVSWLTVKPDNQMLSIQEPQHSSGADTNSNLVVDKWDSAEKVVDSDSSPTSMADSSNESLDTSSIPTPESEPDLSHSGVEEFAYQLSEDATNTGSVTLDRTVYPYPFDTTSGDPAESVIVSIIIPILVVVAGIIIERILSRWWNKRKEKK